MPDRDDVAAADEDLGLAELDVAVDQERGAQDDEGRLAVLLELGPLVGVARVLDRELVELELPLELAQLVLVGLVDADPDEMAGPRRPGAALFDCDVRDLAPGAVGSRSNHLAHPTASPAAPQRRSLTFARGAG